MKNILLKFEEQNKKANKAIERELNRICIICKKSMKENGFGSIPRICKVCENNEVYK